MTTNFKLLVGCIKGRELRSFSITMRSCDHCTCGRLSGCPFPCQEQSSNASHDIGENQQCMKQHSACTSS